MHTKTVLPIHQITAIKTVPWRQCAQKNQGLTLLLLRCCPTGIRIVDFPPSSFPKYKMSLSSATSNTLALFTLTNLTNSGIVLSLIPKPMSIFLEKMRKAQLTKYFSGVLLLISRSGRSTSARAFNQYSKK